MSISYTENKILHGALKVKIKSKKGLSCPQEEIKQVYKNLNTMQKV